MKRLHAGIELIHLTKEYGDKSAICDLSLTVPPGSIYCLLGPNGAGKTTTIKTIMGLRNPTRGDVLINGISIHSGQIHEARRCIGYLQDELLLYEHLTGREYLHFMGELYGVRAGLGDRIQAAMERFELVPDADAPIRQYSLGMKKKVALLATLVHEPEMLIYDEPTGALDALAARQVKEIMLEYKNAGRLVCFTTHIMEIAERFADRLAIINEGSLCFEGSMQELRNRHARRAEETLEEIFIRVVRKPGGNESRGQLASFPKSGG